MQRLLPACGLLAVLGALFVLTSPEEAVTHSAGTRPAAGPSPEAVLERAAAHLPPPAAAQARQGLARLHSRRGAFASAARELEAAVALHGGGKAAASAEAQLGAVLLAAGDLRAARDRLAHAAKVLARDADPSDRGFVFFSEVEQDPGEALLGLAQVAKAGGQYEEALRALRRADPWVDREGAARLAAAECDVLQMQRSLSAAIRRCFAALSLQPPGHPDRPYTDRVLGLVYYFGGDPRRALGVHARAHASLARAGADYDAAWLREYMIDDEAAVQEELGQDPGALAPLTAEMAGLVAGLRAAPEPVWWRVSDAELRLADLHRKMRQWDEAEAAVARALQAFQSRPEGWDQVPDYATIFELAGVLAKERGDAARAQQEFERARDILEGCADATVDVDYLSQEIDAIAANRTQGEEEGEDAEAEAEAEAMARLE